MNNKRNKKCSSSTKQEILILKPMPEIDFLDPVTGKLPKNVQELIKARRSGLTSVNSNSACKSKRDSFEFKLQPMPEISLIDPITGKLPKNYKEILAQNKGTLPKRSCHSNMFSIKGSGQKNATGSRDDRRRSKNLIFDVSPLQMNESLSTVGQTRDNNYKKVRKALFVNPGQSSSIPKPDVPNRMKRTQNTKVDESLLLDIEESERRLFMPKKKQKMFLLNVAQPQKTPVHKTQKSSKKRSTTSSSSLEEFVKLEQQVKTPRNVNKPKSKIESNLSEIIDNIMKKFNENIVLYEKIKSEIVANNIEINKSLNQIVKYLEDDRKNSTTAINSIDAGRLKEDIFRIENISPNTQYRCGEIGLVNNLRVATLQKNLEKKVMFEIEAKENNIHTPSKNNSRSTSKSTRTPNTMLRSVSKRANEQLLKLQDTPKSTLNPIKRFF